MPVWVSTVSRMLIESRCAIHCRSVLMSTCFRLQSLSQLIQRVMCAAQQCLDQVSVICLMGLRSTPTPVAPMSRYSRTNHPDSSQCDTEERHRYQQAAVERSSGRSPECCGHRQGRYDRLVVQPRRCRRSRRSQPIVFGPHSTSAAVCDSGTLVIHFYKACEAS